MSRTMFEASDAKKSEQEEERSEQEQQQSVSVFIGKPDRYGGLLVVSGEEPCDDPREDPCQLDRKVKSSLKTWRSRGVRGVWFKVRLEDADWIPVLARNGFRFHHARDKYAMMVLWQPKDETCPIPKYAHHYVGVGALVLNASGQVLVVQERYPSAGNVCWKLPGGYMEPSEDVAGTAQREVWEETGLHVEFLSVLSFRHSHGGLFGCSDLYFVCEMRIISDDESLKMCERELVACRWMDLEEFSADPTINETNRLIVQNFMERRSAQSRILPTVMTGVVRPMTMYTVQNT